MNISRTIAALVAFLHIEAQAIIKLSDQDIQEIYDTYVKINDNPHYLGRYNRLPVENNTGPWRWEGKDFPRVIAILEFERIVRENGLRSKKGLAINFIDPEWHYLPHETIIQSNYDQDPLHANLYSLDLPDKDFDFVMVNQTFEHTYDILTPLENLYKHMKAGGILYFNVPVNNIPHTTPFHYYTGLTPTGVGALVKAAGFKIVSIGQWGNVEYVTKMYQMNHWPDYRQLSNPGFNDINCPVITWIFAIKE